MKWKRGRENFFSDAYAPRENISTCLHIVWAYRVYQMKRTNIVMDEDLVRQGLKATGMKTRRALVHHALAELVRREKQKGFLALKGKVKWTGDLNEMRRSRFA